MSLKILGSRTYFWQWDTGQKLVVDNKDCGEVHFCNGSGDCTLGVPIVTAEDGSRVADVPDVLLQTAKPVRAYLFQRSTTGAMTRKMYTFQVLPRTKPADYVYTEPEKQTWEYLNERIDQIETRLDEGDFAPGGGGGISYAAIRLLVDILGEALYTSDQSENIRKLKEALEKGAEDDPVIPDEPEEPVIPKLATPVIRLETVGEPEEPSEPDEPDAPEESTTAILGIAVLGRMILGDSGGNIPKLEAPVIQLVTDDAPVEPDEPDVLKLATPVIWLESDAEPEPEEPEIPKLTAPEIYLETVAEPEPDIPDEPEEPVIPKLETPEIYLEVIEPVVVKLATPIIELVEV